MHRLRVIFPHYSVNHRTARAEIERKAKQTFGVPANCMIKCNLLFAINFSTCGCKHSVSCVYAYVRFKRVLSLPAVGVWNSLSAWHILDVYVNMQVQVVGYADLWVCFFLGDTINPRNNETYSLGFTFFRVLLLLLPLLLLLLFSRFHLILVLPAWECSCIDSSKTFKSLRFHSIVVIVAAVTVATVVVIIIVVFVECIFCLHVHYCHNSFNAYILERLNHDHQGYKHQNCT